MTMISMSGLDLSSIDWTGGGSRTPPPRPPQRKARVALGNGAIIIDLDKARVELRGPASKKAKAAAAAIAAIAVAKQKARAATRAKHKPRSH